MRNYLMFFATMEEINDEIEKNVTVPEKIFEISNGYLVLFIDKFTSTED